MCMVILNIIFCIHINNGEFIIHCSPVIEQYTRGVAIDTDAQYRDKM